MPAPVLLLLLLTFVLSYIGVDRLRRWADGGNLLDIPNERSSHTRPVPRGGGLVIMVLSTGGLLLVWFWSADAFPTALFAYLAGACLIAGVSWLDDLNSLPNRVRFAAHAFGAILAVLTFGYWRVVDIPLLGSLNLGWLGLVITVIWIVGLTNAYNFMDGIDGIAGGQAVVGGLGWVALGWLTDQSIGMVWGALLATSSMGFLGHNWPPAHIFMGDVGSAFLGYSFAVLAVMTAQDDPRMAVAGVMLVWPFVFDTTYTLLRRWRKGENIFSAHRSHLYQRLVIAGYSHRFVSLLYLALASVGALLALGWVGELPFMPVGITVAVPMLCLGLWFFVLHVETRHS